MYPDHDQKEVGPDLDPNRFDTLIVFVKESFGNVNFEKSADDNRSMKNYQQRVKSHDRVKSRDKELSHVIRVKSRDKAKIRQLMRLFNLLNSMIALDGNLQNPETLTQLVLDASAVIETQKRQSEILIK